ncbi:MAG: Gfo/Idh/MocA family oxidoreductase [Anaerolineae bacterium]|nr:Gfo/Idh/MocA family oxidoreductase [Anaerolineae bacterium]
MSYKVGILGFAHGHVSSYCTMWQKHSEMDMEVVAGWDHDAARLEKAQQSFGLVPCASIEELLAREDITGVVIGAETSLHADLVEKAAAAGKQIVLQKPIALTLPEADRIVNAVKAAGVPFTMAWQMRVDPQNRKIKELLETGEVGKPSYVRRRHGLSLLNWPGFLDMWHAKPELNRDIWADDTAHAIDFIYWLLGKPESVTAEISTMFNPRLPNNNGTAVFRYADGSLAEVVCSFTCAAAENTVEVFAEKGSIVQNYGDGPSCNVPRPADAVGLKWYTFEKGDWTVSDIPSPANHGERIAGLAQPLSEFFHGQRGPIATAEEGRTVLRMLLASYLSSMEGRRVQIDEPAAFECQDFQAG